MSHNFIHFLNELEVFFMFVYPRYQHPLNDTKYIRTVKKQSGKKYESIRRTKIRKGNSSIDSASIRYHGQGSQEI